VERRSYESPDYLLGSPHDGELFQKPPFLPCSSTVNGIKIDISLQYIVAIYDDSQ
jgi:hypothetical protein